MQNISFIEHYSVIRLTKQVVCKLLISNEKKYISLNWELIMHKQSSKLGFINFVRNIVLSSQITVNS